MSPRFAKRTDTLYSLEAGKGLVRTAVWSLMMQRYWNTVPGSARMVLAMSGGVVFVKDEETVLRLAGSDGKEAANELQEPDAAMAAEAKVAVATVVIVAMEDNRRSKITAVCNPIRGEL